MIPLLKKMLKISLENCFRTQYMKKLFTFILLGLFSCSSVYACGGDFYTGLFDFSKEHKICGKYARSMDGDDFQKNDAYCDCRERLDNKKKYGVEKIFD